MIRPEFWSDEKLASVSREARLTYAGLWGTSDDYGVTKGSPAWLKSQIFPYDEDLKLAKFLDWLRELETLRRIIPFAQDGEKYYYIPKFTEHQKVDKPSKTRNPVPPPDIESRQSRECSASDSRESSDETETEVKLETEKETHTPPSGGVGACVSGNAFDAFWSAYPRKVGKLAALKAWQKLKTPATILPKILEAITLQRDSPQWTKEGGRFVPHPATWLNQGRWEDEPETPKGRCPGFDEKGNVVWR